MSEPLAPLDDYSAFQEAVAGTYSIERELGRGGMGVVYLARDVALDRPVALKVLHAELSVKPEQRERFLREARTGARLSHPHIVPIYAVEEAAGFVFFAMALIDGEPLGEKVRREGPVAPAEAERILREVGWALGYAHAMGILHRDITLDNVLLERSTGRAVLADFGIAAEVDRAGEGPLVGTPAYLAPELVRQEPPSVQSDLYSLGVMSWAMLAGHFPYDGDTIADVLLKHATEPVPSVIAASPATSRRVAIAVERCLAKAPAERPESVEHFLRLLSEEQSSVELASPLRRWLTRDQRIKPIWAFALPMAAMLSVGDIINVTLNGGQYGWGSWYYVTPLLIRFGIVLGTAAVANAGFELQELRRVLKAGYSLEDLRLALRRRPERRASALPSVLGRVLHDLSWISAGTILLMYQCVHVLWYRRWDNVLDYGALDTAVSFVVQWAWVILWTGVGAGFVLPVSPIKRLRRGRFGERLWNSRVGAVLARIAGLGLGRALPSEQTLHRPTELVLDLAIEDLWSALPEATRSDLHALPTVARNLRRRVTDLRELLDQVNAPDVRQSAETAALRARLEERHTAGIVALERLRLHLGQLSGEARPASDFTQQLEGAAALEVELLEELGAHSQLRKQLTRRKRPAQLTPTPTPA